MAYGQTGQQEPRPQGGTITDSYDNTIGKLTPYGDKLKIQDRYGNLQGFIGKDGTMTDKCGNRTGQIKK
jgi:hypothetical protein